MSQENTRKVVPLRLAPPPAEWVSTATVRTLRDFLHMVERGELEGVILVGVKEGNRNYYGWTGEAERNPLAALGAVERLKKELLTYARMKGY